MASDSLTATHLTDVLHSKGSFASVPVGNKNTAVFALSSSHSALDGVLGVSVEDNLHK